MIARTFVSLDVVFDAVLNCKKQFGSVNYDRYQHMKNKQPDPRWKADIRCNEALLDKGDNGQSGTFAFWLPASVDSNIVELPFDQAASNITHSFNQQLQKMEEVYRPLFGISQRVSDQDVCEDELDFPDWVAVEKLFSTSEVIDGAPPATDLERKEEGNQNGIVGFL